MVRSAQANLDIPNELLHKILTCVFADAVHSVCLDPSESPWSMNVLSTFASVCFRFKEISTEVAIKTFGVQPPEDGSSVFPLVYENFKTLRALGARARDPYKSASFVLPSNGFSRCPLFSAYSLYLAAIDLRQNAAQTNRDIYLAIHESISVALSKARLACKIVQPKEMTVIIKHAVKIEITFAKHGAEIVQASLELEGSLDRMSALKPPTGDDDDARARYAIISTIHEVLQRIERASCSIWKSNTCDNANQGLELPGVIPTLKRLRSLQLGVDADDVCIRADSLIDKWSGASSH